MYRSWGSNGLALHLDCNSPDGPGGGREGETSLRVIQEGLKGPMKVERHGVREPSVDGDPEPCRNEAQWEVTVRSGILTFILSVVAGRPPYVAVPRRSERSVLGPRLSYWFVPPHALYPPHSCRFSGSIPVLTVCRILFVTKRYPSLTVLSLMLPFNFVPSESTFSRSFLTMRTPRFGS